MRVLGAKRLMQARKILARLSAANPGMYSHPKLVAIIAMNKARLRIPRGKIRCTKVAFFLHAGPTVSFPGEHASFAEGQPWTVFLERSLTSRNLGIPEIS